MTTTSSVTEGYGRSTAPAAVQCARSGVRQVMEEGERLSKKQLAQESTIKKLRVSSKEVAAEKARLEAQLAQDQGQLASTRHALEAANASLQVPTGCLRGPMPWIMVRGGTEVTDNVYRGASTGGSGGAQDGAAAGKAALRGPVVPGAHQSGEACRAQAL